MPDNPLADKQSIWSIFRRKRGLRLLAVLLAACLAATLLVSMRLAHKPVVRTKPARLTRVLKPPEAAAVLGTVYKKRKPKSWHPPHRVKVWTARYKGKIFSVTQLPHCEHLETLITYNPSGESLKQAKIRSGGIAAATGSFHNTRTMVLADFLQRKGCIVSPARTGRGFVMIQQNGDLDISCDYRAVKYKAGVSALALGQRLVPLERDGFTVGFMNRVTDRMAIGLNRNFIFVVRSQSSIWRLAGFMRHTLPVTSAINCDGGHVVRGKGPVHIVFRWKKVGRASILSSRPNPPASIRRM